MTEITIIENGPAIVKPAINDYIKVEGKNITHVAGVDKPLAICRCGKSANGVMCDGSHNKAKEQDKTEN